MINIPPNLKAYPSRYFGNKKALLKHILPMIPPNTTKFFEPFGGTGIVAWAVAQAGIKVIINEVLFGPHIRHQALIANRNTFLDKDDLAQLFRKSQDGIFRSRYACIVGNDNAAFLDGLSVAIPKLNNQIKKDIATAIPCILAMENIDFGTYRFTASGALVDGQSLDGINMKSLFADFIDTRLPLLIHDNKQNNEAHNVDALELIGKINADVMYADVPYVGKGGGYESMNAFFDDWCHYLQGNSNHVVNSYDGKADLPPYTRFDIRSKAIQSFMALFDQSRHIPLVIVSYNTTSGIHPVEIVNIAKSFGREIKSTYIPHKIRIHKKGNDSNSEEVLIIARNPAGKIHLLKKCEGEISHDNSATYARPRDYAEHKV